MSNSEKPIVPLSKDGRILVTTRISVTEKEIVEARAAIIQRMHSSYIILVFEMQEFQRAWDVNPAAAFISSINDGWNAAGEQWIEDQKELFDSELWISLGEKIKNIAGVSYDQIAGYSNKQYEFLKKEINKHIENPDDTLYNWAWWQATMDEGLRESSGQIKEQFVSARSVLNDGLKSVLGSLEMAQRIFIHRDEILELPELIAQGDVAKLQYFVDNVLKDIDPQLAKSIRNDPNFAVVLEVIADHDSALSYLAYVGLILEAIPPNFYSYVAGKGGGYLMIEVVLLAVTALLSAGVAAATRISMLIARLTSAGTKLIGVNGRMRHAKIAVSAFLKTFEDMSRAASELHMLGYRLIDSRSRGVVFSGHARTNLTAKREIIKRDKKCRVCGSAKHSTPKIRRGLVTYE